jgi:hypothetical protein
MEELKRQVANLDQQDEQKFTQYQLQVISESPVQQWLSNQMH